MKRFCLYIWFEWLTYLVCAHLQFSCIDTNKSTIPYPPKCIKDDVICHTSLRAICHFALLHRTRNWASVGGSTRCSADEFGLHTIWNTIRQTFTWYARQSLNYRINCSEGIFEAVREALSKAIRCKDVLEAIRCKDVRKAIRRQALSQAYCC